MVLQKKAMIVRADGCYEYHLNHADVLALDNDATKAALEVRLGFEHPMDFSQHSSFRFYSLNILFIVFFTALKQTQ